MNEPYRGWLPEISPELRILNIVLANFREPPRGERRVKVYEVHPPLIPIVSNWVRQRSLIWAMRRRDRFAYPFPRLGKRPIGSTEGAGGK